MNIAHHSNILAMLGLTSVDDAFDDNEEKDSCYIYEQATPEIKVLLIQEQPQGTGIHNPLTLNPAITAASLKGELANLTHVPVEFIRLIHRNTPLKDEMSLHQQGVQPSSTLVMRDSRLVYNFP